MFKEVEVKETHDELIDEMALKCLIEYASRLKREGEQDEQ